MRNVLDHYVISQIGEDEALGERLVLEATNTRAIQAKSDPANLDEPLIKFLGIRDEYELLNRHRKRLPESLAQEIRELTGQLDVIGPARHSSNHYRSFGEPGGEPAAFDRLLTALRSFQDDAWKTLHQALYQLDTDPAGFETLVTLDDDQPERVHHNLPAADYDETGLVGREDDVKRLMNELKQGDNRVITLLGEGGIGKSALALETAYRLLDDEESPFELILWVSLKTERLTAYGVESIANAIDSITGATQHLGTAVSGSNFAGNVNDLANSLGTDPTLIVFDNLETTTGEDFLYLYEELPANVQYLVTSRRGIGQVERRRTVEALSDADAVRLFSWLTKNRQVRPLLGLSNESRLQIVRLLRNSPLAIKWYVMSVEAGRNPIETAKDQEILLNFCVQNVFEQLDDDAKRAALALQILNRSVYQEELSVLTGIPAEDFGVAIRALISHSIVQYKAVAGDLSWTLSLTETAANFLEGHIDQYASLRDQVAFRERELREFNERTQTESKRHYFSPNVVRPRNDADRPAALHLHRAMNDSKNGNLDKALLRVEEARALAPDFSEVPRVEAFILSQHNPELASLKYTQAYRQSESAEIRALTAFFYGGHLARSVKDLQGAQRYLREAHEYFDSPDTARALGSNLVWLREFDNGIELLERASSQATGKAYVISVSLLVDAIRRRAEFHLNESQSAQDAWNDCRLGWQLGVEQIERGSTDERFISNLWKQISQALLTIIVAMESGFELDGTQDFLRDVAEKAAPLKKIPQREAAYIMRRLDSLAQDQILGEDALALINVLNDANIYERPELHQHVAVDHNIDKPVDRSDSQAGVITNINRDRGFGFIKTEAVPSGVFFHFSVLKSPLDFGKLQVGDEVQVKVEVQKDPSKAPAALEVHPPLETSD